MNIEIKPMNREHLAASLALSNFAFQVELTKEEREKRIARMEPDGTWGAFVDGHLASRLTLLSLQTWIQGKVFAMGGIAGVATWPEYRRGGLVGRLLAAALRQMKDSGQTVSFLHPFQFGFYRRFGWETYTEYKKYEIPVGLLPKLSPQPGRIERVTDNAVPVLAPIYETFASRYNGSLSRDEDWWNKRVLERKKGTIAVYYDEAGEPAGYVLYQVKDKVCAVHELVSLHHGARLALWRFLSDHDSMMEKLTVEAPADDQLPFLLDNPRIGQTVVPYFMARIVDAASFIAQYPFASGTEATFRLTLSDEHAEWNQGELTVAVDESGTARIVDDADAPDLPRAACDIQTLTALLLSYQRPAALREIGRLKADAAAVELLTRLVPAKTTYLPDFF